MSGILAAAVLLSMFWTAAPAQAQRSGGIVGTIKSESTGQPLADVTVFLSGSSRRALSNAEGRFALSAVPVGPHTIVAERLGLASTSMTVTVVAGGAVRADFVIAEAPIAMSQIVVTASRDAQDRSRVAASVGVVDQSAIDKTQPSHPSDIMGRVAGVWVNTTGGEGHMTAIRQPLSTSPLYLYLEDGVPTRSTGFFNHNALYEVNVPQADRIEVMKGPANALYGSDAIGGVINVGTRRPSEVSDGRFSLEGGDYGYARLLGSLSGTTNGHGLRADLNLTRTDGWRDGTAYDRQSGTVRWDKVFDGGLYMKTVATFSSIDQGTAGSSAISRDDFETDPEINYTPISFRKVRALRISTALEKQAGSGVLSVTPFFRYNSMDLLPNWSLTFDPAIWETENLSYGLLIKYGLDLSDKTVRLTAGVDLDYSPGSRFERAIDPNRTGKIFDAFAPGSTLYDYDVTYQQLAPYLQAVVVPTERLTLQAGLRGDFLRYDYDNRLSATQEGRHRRPGDAEPGFSNVSPKFGATYSFGQSLSLFGSYKHGFRAPSEGQIFRQGVAINTLELDPVKVRSSEFGVRGVVANRFSYEATAYRMTKEDDILSFRHPDGTQETVNAGETLHRGIELGAGVEIVTGLELNVAYSYAKHTYEDWRPNGTTDFSGNEQEFAPREIGNATLAYELPGLEGSNLEIEWSRLGSYYEDASNENEYEGHDLFNVRASVPLKGGVRVFARVQNLTDKLYAERASFNARRGEELSPGLPRTFYAGLSVSGGF